MNKKVSIIFLILTVTILFTGCYDIDGGLSFNEDGETTVLVDINADEIMGGEEARILAWQLEFLFPEIDLNYEKTMKKTTINYQDYLEISFAGKEEIDISESEYFEFEQKSDGSFEFIADIPAIINDPSKETKDDVVLNFFVELPDTIDMANSTRVEDNYAEWRLTKDDLTTETQLRAFTE